MNYGASQERVSTDRFLSENIFGDLNHFKTT
jgi:hypothetical protein